ncbi:MAG: formimidoylglutamase, partial [Nitrospinota bacterium]
MNLKPHYKPSDKNRWQGRVDPDENSLRLHQVIQFLDLKELHVTEVATRRSQTSGKYKKIALIGFCCDEGIRRNQGRPGAREGAGAIRNTLANSPVHFNEKVTQVFDAGDILYQESATTSDDPLLSTQLVLSTAIQILLSNRFFPIVLGGGHEVAFGHFHGIHSFLHSRENNKPKENIGIINFDAHFDLRAFQNNQGTSGTPFLQIAKLCGQDQFHYLCLGIQKTSNTKKLFHTAEELGVQYVLADEINERERQTEIMTKIETFIMKSEFIYLTICLDVFDSAFAPGVSAPASNGLGPQYFFPIMGKILRSNKVIGMDIAEMSPAYDIDQHTAKLASLIFFNLIS